MAKNNGSSGPSSYMAAYRALGDHFGQLGVWLASERSAKVHKFTLRQRSAFDWVAVLSVWDDAGGRLVAFGNGHDSVGALLGLAGSIAGDRWQKDKFYDESDGTS